MKILILILLLTGCGFTKTDLIAPPGASQDVCKQETTRIGYDNCRGNK